MVAVELFQRSVAVELEDEAVEALFVKHIIYKCFHLSISLLLLNSSHAALKLQRLNVMKKKAALVCLSLSFVWIFLLVSEGIAKEPAEALVSVVSLDEQGNPWRQGMGILVGKEGSVLTSASIMAECRSGVVKTADGALHIIQKISLWDSLQDVALLQIEPESSKIVAVGMAWRLQPPEKVWVGIRQKTDSAIAGSRPD